MQAREGFYLPPKKEKLILERLRKLIVPKSAETSKIIVEEQQEGEIGYFLKGMEGAMSGVTSVLRVPNRVE